MKYTLTTLLFLWVFLCVNPARGNPESTPPENYPTAETSDYAPPGVGFTYNTNGGCVPVIVQFYSQLAGPTYNWNFGDLGTSTQCNPVHVYTTPGTYVVTLNATGGSYTDTIVVGDTPVVTLTSGDLVNCLGDTKAYTVSSTIPPAQYSWNVQGGQVIGSPTATTINIKWNTYGINYINYTITTAQGCTRVFRFAIKVIPPPQVNLPCCEKRPNEDGTQGKFNGEPGHEGIPGGSEPCDVCANSYSCYQGFIHPDFGLASDYTWQWSVTNGVIDTISGDSTRACVIWGASGTGTIKLILTHKIYGCQTIKECEVTIKPGINPVFNVSGACVNWPVNFDASATTPLADVVSYFWEFGDGYTETTTGPSASHQYSFTGTYTATLTITTKEGCEYKVQKTFNVINGTRPIIVCPGTVCKGSRSCYSTALISGATYVWNITGDVPAQQTVSADGNEICVTWGNGPVGTVTVTVLNGGYTCTNTSTEVVAIVDQVIPIAGPNYICNNTSFVEVSTANYAGACYKWTINGTPQGALTNVLQFNALAYSNPIDIKVEVDFGLGCCHGEGTKQIIKLPQYEMFPYQTNVCVGSTHTYNMFFPAGPPSSNVSWSVEGGTIGPSGPTWVTVTWNTVGVGSITAGNNTPSEYCNDGSNNTWNVTVWDKATGEDIAGPTLVCADGTTSYTYYHGFEYPTASATVSVSPGGTTVIPGTYSSDIKFNVPGTYTISVTYNHAVVSPCPTTKTYIVKAVSPSVPVFTPPAGPVCTGDTKTYTASMSDPNDYEVSVIGGAIVSQTWAAGTTTLTVQWNSTVNSSITVTNKACATTNTQTITVHGRPVVIITPGPVVCGVGSVTLNVAPIWASYTWSGPSITPGGPGIATVNAPGNYSCTASNGFCTNSATINVPVVNPTPPTITGFTVTPPPSNFCPKYQQICPTVVPGTGGIVSYSWSFSGFNITTSSATCPSVALPSTPGVFFTGNWTLTVTDSYGCTHSLGGSLTDSCSTPTPDPPCPQPYAATFNTPTYNPCTGQFTTSGTNYTNVYWDFGDGTSGWGVNPFHPYATACTKNVTCYVVDINGCVQAFGPYAIAVPYTFNNPQINVTNSVCTGASSISVAGFSECGTPTASYTWYITGATSCTTSTTVPTLNVGSLACISNGPNSVTVIITVGTCTKTISGTFNKGGLQAFFLSCGGCSGSPLTFIDQSTPYSAPIIQWAWTFNGPSGTITSSLQNPTVNFSNSGLHSCTLTVTDNVLCTHTYITSVMIQAPPALGNIKVNGIPYAAGTLLNICPGSTNMLEAPSAGPGTTWVWSDGNTNQIRPVTAQGDYYVTVFPPITNCPQKLGPIKFRYKPAPEAIIEPSGNACSPRLLNAFKGTGYTYTWSFPAGSGWQASPTSIYLTSSANVTLTVTNLHGCTASVTQPFTVHPSPSAFISYAPAPFCPGSVVTLNGNPSGGTGPYSHLWNNGATTQTVPNISTPGLYKYTVTDANGCKATAQLNLQPVLPSGMDKLPYGCYDVCGPVSFCTGLMPWGWTGQWYLDGSPYGPSIPYNGSLATTFNSPGTYELHYIPIDATIYCPAVSRPITLNFITLPDFTIIASDPTLLLCTNSGANITLTVDPQDPDFAYNWYLNGVYVASGFTYVATQAGHYQVEIIKNPCCKKYIDIVIDTVECCFENAGVPFTPILAPLTVSSNEFWFDKYYVDATITVVGSAELDLTNVDMVFGPNGQIVLVGNSFLRCNNSVLRPCKKDDIWQGVTFFEQSSGWINTTTIKNAKIGVQIIGNDRGVRLTDNSFVKCHKSVWIRNSRNQKSISGNTFEVDDTPLPYPQPFNEYWAIRLDDVDMKGLIAQNNFRHVNPQKAGNYYYGIYSRSSTYTASENRFNDMYRAVDISGSRNVIALEENEIKLNTLKETYSFQIRVTDCETPVLIYENRMDNSLGDNSVATAIYCDNTYRTHIKDNKINGFWNAIVSSRTNSIHVASNEITSNRSVGISMFESNNAIISCNTIKAMASNATQFGGNPKYGIRDEEGNENYEYANCIFDQHTAIYLFSSSGSTIPTLVNNYLYNYRDNGIYNDGYNGDIGSGPGVNAGRNTFMSNNGAAGTTVDINSVFGNGEGGNFGILMTNNVWSYTGTDEYYSTASCGQQIQQTYPNNQLDRYNICDVYYLEEWVWIDGEGRYNLKAPTAEVTSAYINEQLAAKNQAVIGQVAGQMLLGSEPAKRAADAVLASAMDKNVAARVIVNHSLAIGDVQLAKTILASPQLSGIDADLRTVLETDIAIFGKQDLNAYQLGAMKGIDNKNNTYSPIARDIIHSYNGEHDYKFRSWPEPQPRPAENSMVRTYNSLNVYPVPSYDEITVKYNVTNAKVQGIKIVSSIGAEVANFTYTLQGGEVMIDISSLAAGVYTVTLVTDSEEQKPMNGRFIKLQ